MVQSPFEVIAQMHKMDIENNTRLVSVSPSLVSANLVKQGSNITMGADASVFNDIAISETHMAILVVVEKKKYFELTK